MLAPLASPGDRNPALPASRPHPPPSLVTRHTGRLRSRPALQPARPDPPAAAARPNRAARPRAKRRAVRGRHSPFHPALEMQPARTLPATHAVPPSRSSPAGAPRSRLGRASRQASRSRPDWSRPGPPQCAGAGRASTCTVRFWGDAEYRLSSRGSELTRLNLQGSELTRLKPRGSKLTRLKPRGSKLTRLSP